MVEGWDKSTKDLIRSCNYIFRPDYYKGSNILEIIRQLIEISVPDIFLQWLISDNNISRHINLSEVFKPGMYLPEEIRNNKKERITYILDQILG